ncbi:MAG: putative peptidoglycan lipid flippase, partial [Actinomycetota bacterium]|nr:putative peptidoglycan lipid flippase [Actinomycetota bacterium]
MEGGGERSLARGAALVTALTAISRLTGFLRVVAIAAAMGTTFLANTYQTANTAPNLIFELVAAGVLTSVFVPTFVDYLVRGEREKSWDAANALTSVALVGLIVIALVVAALAPLIMRLLLIGVTRDVVRENAVSLGTTFLRLFAPQIVFYGAGMIMTAALHAHRRFTMPALAPIFNNVVVIGVYLTYIAIREGNGSIGSVSSGEALLLGAGTTMGVVAMTLCLLPSLRRLGWRFRFDFDPRHPAVRRGARLGGWALGYAGGYQAGLIVVLILANRIEGGVAAYQWAYTFFYLPHALVGVPIFNVLFTAMAEHVSQENRAGVVERLVQGLAMLAFILLPLSGLMIVVAGPVARLTLGYGLMTVEGAALVGRVLSAFALGLAAFSSFLVMTRAFYALSDTRTPAVVNAGTMVAATSLGALAFAVLPESWAVAGLALGHSLGYVLGAVALERRLATKLGADLIGALRSPLARALAGAFIATAVMTVVHNLLPDTSNPALFVNVVLTTATGAGAFWASM